MSRSIFSKIATADGTYFLLTKLKEEGKEGIGLTLSNGRCSWIGEISEDDLDNLCIKMKMDFNRYVAQTIRALTGEKDESITFQYQTKPRKATGSIDFIWKKHVATENITFQLGTVILKEADESSSVTCDLFSHCIDSMSQLKTKIHSLETDNERLAHDRTNANKRLEKCVVAKEELETDLYSKFAEILNCKKEKIRQLKDEIESMISQDRSKETEPKPKINKTEKMEVTEEQLSVSSGEADDTGDESPSPPVRRRAKPKKFTKVTAEDSLILDDDLGDTRVVARPKRRRQLGNKKQTPSKPSLPRISSKTSLGSSGSSEGRRTSMRQSVSSASNKSNDNINADDLIEDML